MGGGWEMIVSSSASFIVFSPIQPFTLNCLSYTCHFQIFPGPPAWSTIHNTITPQNLDASGWFHCITAGAGLVTMMWRDVTAQPSSRTVPMVPGQQWMWTRGGPLSSHWPLVTSWETTAGHGFKCTAVCSLLIKAVSALVSSNEAISIT